MADKEITVTISPVTQDQLRYLRETVAEAFDIDPDSYSLDDIISLCISRAAEELLVSMTLAEVAGITDDVKKEARRKYDQRTEPREGDLEA